MLPDFTFFFCQVWPADPAGRHCGRHHIAVDTSGLGTSISGSVLVDSNPFNTQLLNGNGKATVDLGSAQVIKGYSLTDDPSNAAFNPSC